MKSLKEIFTVWGRMFSRWKYVLVFIISGFTFYLLNGLISNFSNFGSFYDLFGLFGTVKFAFISALGFIELLTPFNAVAILVLSVLVGMMISLLAYRHEYFSVGAGKVGFLGSMGLFLGVAAPGCAACGVGLISLLGLSSVLALLPYKGHEIIVFAIVLTTISVMVLSRKLYNPVCKVKPMHKIKNNMKGGKN
jgi:hypothetical protein